MIRQATTQDAIQIAVLIRRKAEALKAGGSEQWSAYLKADLDALVADDFAAGRLYVYEQNGELLGSVALLPSLDWDKALWDDAEGLYIHRIVVSASAKGSGIGKQLIQHVISVATAEQECLRLDCIASNSFLNSYYSSFGFESRGMRDGFSTYEYPVAVESY